MAAVFERDGLRFRFPENWQLEEADSDDGWTVSLQSPATAFMVISVYPERPPVSRVLEAALATLREDIPDLEAEDASEKIADHRAVGHDIQFFCFDLTNSCWTRSFRTRKQTVLILCQTNDTELDYAEPVLRAIRASMEVADA